MTPDYRFTKRPAWLIGHVIVLVAIVSFVNLGLWQLRRHDERTALDDRVAERIVDIPVDLQSARSLATDDLELRQVAVEGSWDAAREVVLLARTLNGRSGHNVLTPLVVSDGSAVVVNRGWIPIDFEGPPVVGATPPTGDISIVVVARQTEVRRGLGPTDSPDGALDTVSRVDLDRLAAQFPYPLESFYLQLVSPAPEGFPLVLPLPEPGGPPHLAYAVQWFAFAGVVAVGYPLLLRSTARKTSS